MTENIRKDTGFHARWPIFWTLLLLLGCAGVCWLIWERYETHLNEALALEKEKETLKQRETFLKNLVTEEPCKALEKFRLSTKELNKE